MYCTMSLLVSLYMCLRGADKDLRADSSRANESADGTQNDYDIYSFSVMESRCCWRAASVLLPSYSRVSPAARERVKGWLPLM